MKKMIAIISILFLAQAVFAQTYEDCVKQVSMLKIKADEICRIVPYNGTTDKETKFFPLWAGCQEASQDVISQSNTCRQLISKT